MALGTLLERVLRRLSETWAVEREERDGEAHEATESDKERDDEAKRALKLLKALYPDMELSITHKPADDFDQGDDEPAKTDDG